MPLDMPRHLAAGRGIPTGEPLQLRETSVGVHQHATGKGGAPRRRVIRAAPDDEDGGAGGRRPEATLPARVARSAARFEVRVEFHWPSRRASGWRAGALIDAARISEPSPTR